MKIILLLLLTKLKKFASQVDNFGCWLPISTYVDEQVCLEKKLFTHRKTLAVHKIKIKFVTFAQFDKFLEAETRVNRIELVDSRYISKNNFMNRPCKEFSG